MELNNKCRDKVKDLIENINDIDVIFYKYLFEILEDNIDFLEDKEVVFYDSMIDAPANYDFKSNRLSINVEKLFMFSKKWAYELAADIHNEKWVLSATRYLILVTIYHELTHAEQGEIAYTSYVMYKYPELKRLYRSLIDMDSKFNFMFKLNYRFRGDQFCFERNANLSAFKEVLEIVPDDLKDVMKINYLYNYFYGYNPVSKYNTPVRKTFNMGNRKCDIISEGIPVNIRLDHGLDLNIEEYQKYILDFDDLEPKTYDEVIRRLK